MMRTVLFLLLASTGGLCFVETSCAGNSTAPSTGTAADSTAAADISKKTTLPPDADSARVDFRDLRWYTDKGLFCIVGIVDNLVLEWQRIWLRVEILDTSGRPLTIDGEPSVVVPTFADAVPPRGSTSFFYTVPVQQLSGTPSSCRVRGAGAVTMGPGPIMISSELGGVRALRPDPNDPTNIVEEVYQMQATIENPLDMTAYHPRYVLLVYGQDKLLHYAEVINPEQPGTPLRQQQEGPIGPREKRQILYPIYYENLPQALRDTLIQWVDVQVFDARQ